MPELNDLWDWLAYVRETNAFLIALPSFVGFVLACVADWIEAYLTRSGEPASSQEQTLTRPRKPMTEGEPWHASTGAQVSSRAS